MYNARSTFCVQAESHPSELITGDGRTIPLPYSLVRGSFLGLIPTLEVSGPKQGFNVVYPLWSLPTDATLHGLM